MTDVNKMHAEDEYITDDGDCEVEMKKLEEKCLKAQPEFRCVRSVTRSKRGRPSKKVESCVKLREDFLRPLLGATKPTSGSAKTVNVRSDENPNDIRSVIEGVSSDLRQDFGMITTKINSLCSMLNILVDRVEELENQDEKRSEQLHQQEKKISELESKFEEHERRFRLKSVLLTHPEIDSTSRTLNVDIKKFLVDNMKMKDSVADMVSISKFGRGSKTVLLDFPSVEIKKQLYGTKKLLRESMDPKFKDLFINDFLTRKKSELLKNALDLKKAKRIHTAFSMDGNVFVRINEHDEKRLVRDVSDLDY